MSRRIGIATIAAMLVLAWLPMAASAATESGSASRWPWSGSWWPMYDYASTTSNLYANGGALQKYDAWASANGMATGARAWERANRYTDRQADTWWGYCHAWSAASILAPEPRAVTRSGIQFTAEDAKGLTTALYYEPTYTWLSGNRVDDPDDTASAAYQDIAPAWMDYLLRYYIGHYRYPFIMDLSTGSQVWNYPIFAYERSSTRYAGGIEDVRTRVWYADPVAGAGGTRYKSITYTYRLQDGTSGRWTGDSIQNHPDFAWVPTGKRPSGTNPFVTERNVEAIVGLDV